MNSAALASFLQAVILIGSALTALKLLATGLHKRYPVFFLYFVFRVPNSMWPFYVDIRSHLYLNIWKVTTIVVLVFYVLLVAELYRLVLEKYRGLQTAGRWAMYGSIVISVLISLVSLLLNVSPAKASKTHLILLIERGVDTALAVFILLILAFLSRYPISLSRNAKLHALICSVFFLSNTVSILMRGLFGLSFGDTVNLIISGISVCSVLAWLILLNPSGEELPAGHRRMEPSHEKHLLTQLDFLNGTLLRASRQVR